MSQIDLIDRSKPDDLRLNELGHQVMSQYVTSTTSNVYAIKDTLSNTIVSAAIARLSRSPDDMRVIIANEFTPEIEAREASNQGREIGLLRRVITAYGDDSVQQLGNIAVVVEDASNILTKLLERPRIGAAYIERSTRYILFDTKKLGPDEKMHYRYTVPPELDAESAAEFSKTMDNIFELYSVIVRNLIRHIEEKSTEVKRDAAWRAAVRAQACDAARGILPLCTTSTVGISGSAQAIDSLIMHLRASELQEANKIGNQMLQSVRQVAPVFFERTDMLDRGEAFSCYLKTTNSELNSVIDEICAEASSQDIEDEQSSATSVRLTSVWPEDELTLADRILQSRGQRTTRLTNPQRRRILLTYAGLRLNRRHKPGRMFEEPRYGWQFRTGYAEFRDLQRHRLVDAFEWGIVDANSTISADDIPSLLSEAGLTSQFLSALILSTNLFNMLEDRGYSPKVCQYASLFVHKIEWQWMINLREATHIIELRTTPQGHPAYRKICQDMYAQIEKVHPTLASTIKFVNCGEDAELTRLAAERASAAKLAKLSDF